MVLRIGEKSDTKGERARRRKNGRIMLAKTTTKAIPFLELFQTMGTRTGMEATVTNGVASAEDEHRRHDRCSTGSNRTPILRCRRNQVTKSSNSRLKLSAHSIEGGREPEIKGTQIQGEKKKKV